MQLFQTHGLDEGGAIEYPARSPDLTPMDFFLWGYLKDKVYCTKPRIIDALKMEIERQCRDIPNDLFFDVCEFLGVRYQRCLNNNGRQFEHLQTWFFNQILSSVFETIPFHCMFINKEFLVIRSVEYIFLRHPVYAHNPAQFFFLIQ